MENMMANTCVDSRDKCRANSSPSFSASAGENINGSLKTSKNSSRSETENWLFVRKSLLQLPKFAKCLEEIPETEWLETRAASLKIIMTACSNYHGSSKGDMWTKLTSTVTQYMGPRHEFLKMISDYQDNLWTTCSLVTVTTISEVSLDDKTGDWEESVNQSSLSEPAVTSTTPHQAYGSIELIEPTDKDGHRVCMHHFHWKWMLLYVPLLIALVAGITVAATLLEMNPETMKKVETLEATTVYLDTQKSVWYRGWAVDDCTSSSETVSKNSTTSNIQLVEDDDLVYFEENFISEDMEGYQNTQLLKTLNGPLYLLAGSRVEYQFCLMTNFSGPGMPNFQLFGEFLIFNDITKYFHYIHQSGQSGKEAAIFYQATPVSGVGQQKSCTNVTFRVSQADNYFTIYKLPPHVELHYRSNIHVVYLNYTKYIPKEQTECELMAGGLCEIEIPGNTFSTEEYTLLAYIPLQSSDTAPNSTHLCVTPKQSLLVSVIPSVVATCVLLLLVVVLVCQIISFVINIRRRKGYICIKPINV